MYYIFWVSVCSLRYPARNAHAHHLWPVQLYNIFTHYLINGTIFEKKKKFLNIKYVFFIFCISFVWKILVLRRTGQDIVINVYWSPCKISIIIVRFLRNFSFLDRFSKSTELSDFMKTRLTVSMLFHADIRTDRHDEANSRFSQFHEPTWKWTVASWGVGDTVNI